jgi:DNA modification methylase
MERSQVKPTGGVARGNGFILSRDLNPHRVAVTSCKPLGRETRKHPPAQVCKLAASLDRFGFVLPILIDVQGRVVAGWGLVLAARLLGLNEVPAVSLTDLSDADLRMLRLALNRIADDGAWDRQALALEFAEMLELDPQIELESSGFETGEIELLLDGSAPEQDDELPAIDAEATPVTRRGDLWVLGEHRLLCGDALNAESYALLMGTDQAQMTFADPPDSLPIEGGGAVMASGELSPPEYRMFLRTALDHAARHSIDGAIHYVCINWRHQRELLAASDEVYGELLNMCVWTKSHAEIGSLYRSQHEFVFVFKVGKGGNDVTLRRHGRQRSDVWHYVSDSRFSAKSTLASTVKPVAMIADAMRDCSDRGDLVIDPFGCVGTTLIAAERTGRRARVIELNPILVDASIERWQRLTGGTALHAETGRPFVRTGNVSAGEQIDDQG